MSEPRTYTSATAFRRALEDRLKMISRKENVDLQRLRKNVAFDRFLARLFQTSRSPWILKGGYAMELRMKEARATKDIDLVIREIVSKNKELSKNMEILEDLMEASRQDMKDFFLFSVGEPVQDLNAAPYGGARYPVVAQMEGREFVRFHLDVAVGDIVLDPLELTEGREWLSFAGIKGRRFQTISKEQQFAEKVHAYSLPRPSSNTRVRDLLDMVLLIRTGNLRFDKTREALRLVFAYRHTHSIPRTLTSPPAAWKKPFESMVLECGLAESMDDAFHVVVDYFSKLSS